MQLQTPSSRALSASLQTAAKCIASKTTLAILDHVLLTQRDGKFFFTSATSESQLTIPAPLTLLGGKYDTPVCLPVGGIISYLSTLPDCVVTITLNDDHTLTLDYCTGSDDKVKTGKVSLTYLDGAEFPRISGLADAATHIVLPGSVFSNAIEQARNFCAEDILRPTMNALAIDIAEDYSECIMVASDGHKLIKITHTNDPKTGGSDFYRSGAHGVMLLHNTFFRTMSAFANAESVDIENDGHTMRISSGDIEFLCKAVEGRYPNYNSVIPRENAHFLCFNKKEMLSVIKRVSIFGSDTSKLIKVEKNGMFLTVSAENVDFSTSATDQVVLTESQCKDGFAIGFNGQTFSNAISAIDSDDIRVHLSDPTRAAVLTADDPNPRVLTLVMPMLLNQ